MFSDVPVAVVRCGFRVKFPSVLTATTLKASSQLATVGAVSVNRLHPHLYLLIYGLLIIIFDGFLS